VQQQHISSTLILVTSEPSRKLRKWLVIGACLIVALSLTLPETWVEAGYCKGVFPVIQNLVVPVTGFIPWPLTLTVLLSLPIVWPLLAIRRWRRGRRESVLTRSMVVAGVLRFLRVLLYTAAAFLLMWGIGYRRVPIEERWRLLETKVEYEDVREVGLRLLAVLHRDARQKDAVVDEDAAFRSIANESQKLVSEFEGWTPALPNHLKNPPPGLFLATGIYGVCYPFTLEANVDPALPLPYRLAIGGHELAHILGYCGEADANLVSFIAGLRADDPLARYSTALSMLNYALKGRNGADNMWLLGNLPKRVHEDLDSLASSNKKHRVEAVSKVTTKLNHTYLKTQGVKLGTADYERGFRLFVHAFRLGMVPMPEPFPSREEKLREKKAAPEKK